MKHREGYNYRICSKCGEEWNVSIEYRKKSYICPPCRNKNKRRELNLYGTENGSGLRTRKRQNKDL